MQAAAHARFEKVSSEKANRVLRMIRGRSIDQALTLLSHARTKAAQPVLKTLRSAIANAGNRKLTVEALRVHSAYVNVAPSFFRKPEYRAQGRINFMHKPQAHLTVVLTDDEPTGKTAGRS